MRYIPERSPLSDETRAALAEWTTVLAALPIDAARAEAKRAWSTRRASPPLREIEAKLAEMNGAVADACMYCETPRANHIDHHEPRVRAPARCFDWANLVRACASCDSTHKRDRYLCPERGVPPVDPRSEDPTTHLRVAATGLMDRITPRGAWTCDLLGLDEGSLPEHRRKRRLSLCFTIVRYAALRQVGQAAEAAVRAELIRDGQHPSVLRDLIADALGPEADVLGLGAVRAAVEACPEVREWAIAVAPQPVKRSG